MLPAGSNRDHPDAMGLGKTRIVDYKAHMPESTKGGFAGIANLSYVGFVLAAGVLVYSFVSVAKEGETRRRCAPMCLLHPEYAATNRTAPDFALKDMNGDTVNLSSYRGKVVVLNFWTKTCGPCLEELPSLADLSRILRDRPDVTVLTVSVDQGPADVQDTLRAVLREAPPFPVLFDPENDIVAGKYGTHLFPETWIIDARGVIRARFDGKRNWSSSAVVELVDQLRVGGYCPMEIQDGRPHGDGAKVCDDVGGS
ncbi:TlpA family protein disulfide reductase [Pendulispora albinea]|uniref:TlpA family protein disulfide reductase n=1 Tax=Pendulispora albinea TaxID=2741071 RepID=A0ABZ2LZK9_9BACT